MIAVGGNEITKAYIGSTEIDKIYLGNTLVYNVQSGPPLPYDAQVTYLESTGTQYINTGIYPTSDYTFDCKVTTTVDKYNCVYWGVRSGGTYSSNNLQCYLNSNGTVTDSSKRIHLYSTKTSNSSNWDSGIIPVVNTLYSLKNMTVVSTMQTMTYPIVLFGFNVMGTINTSSGKCRISSWIAYSNGEKVMELIPVRVGQIGYMYDKVSGELFGNAGTGSFILGNDVEPNLPYDSQVEYLESNGTQYIDSGIECTSDLSVKFKFMVPSNSNNAFCGGISTLASGYFRHHASPFENNFYWIQANNNSNSSISTSWSRNTWYEVDIDAVNGTYSINNSSGTFTPISTLQTTGNSFGLFGRIGGGSIALQTRSCKIGYFKLIKNGVLLRDFIPVKFEQVGYMYDKISKQLFGNSGTGTFSYGSDVN